MRRGRLLVALSFAVLGVLAVGCGGGDVSSGDVRANGDSLGNAASGSPLETEFGISSDPRRRQAQLVDLQLKANDRIVRCMAEAGFGYVVERPNVAIADARSWTDDSDDSWAQQRGLGITDVYREVVSGATSVDAEQANRDYVASLSPDETVAYDLALIGPRSTGPTDDLQGQPGVQPGFAPEGCWGLAFGELLVKLAVIDEVGGELETLNSRLSSDPRVRGFNATWAACMEASGHRYADPDEMTDDIYARLLDLEIATDELGNSLVVDPAAVDALAETERAVAVASHACSRPFAGELRELRFDYEREFLIDNRARLSKVVADTTSTS